MNRRQKIIISITGIFIVLLALVGLTYAYFLTRITGNENDKSISVTTKNLHLVYGDNSEEIIKGTGALIPTIGTEEEDAIGTKTFTVTNKGNDTSYNVIIDNIRITKVSDGTPTTFESNDFRYTLTCTKKDGSKCNEQTKLTEFPINGGILIRNNISEKDVHTYTLKLWYIDTGLNQSKDMGKTYQARVNIEASEEIDNPFKEGTLAYSILDNAMTKKHGTEFLEIPGTPVAESIARYSDIVVATEEHGFKGWQDTEYFLYGNTIEAAWRYENTPEGTTDQEICENVKGYYVFVGYSNGDYFEYKVENCTPNGIPKIAVYNDKYESSISVTEDDLGTSYYYRGAVVDNYVTFADKCWRIVRIQGDGSIKLILEDNNEVCSPDMEGNWEIPSAGEEDPNEEHYYGGHFGYTYIYGPHLTDYLHGETEPEYSMAAAFKKFQSTFSDSELSQLNPGNWCLQESGYDKNNNHLTKEELLEELKELEGGDLFYEAGYRLGINSIPSLKCVGTTMNDWEDDELSPTPMYVSALTADEIAYAGAKLYEENNNFYLMNDYYKTGELVAFLTLSPFAVDHWTSSILVLDYTGTLDWNWEGNDGVYENIATNLRPAITLRKDITFERGEGTIDKPYVIE